MRCCLWDKINENQKILGSPPAWAIFKKIELGLKLKSNDEAIMT